MPSKKISDMTALTSTATDDEFVVVDTNVGETKRITSANLKTAMAPDSASASAAGIVELATDAEAQTGTDTARAITAANLQAVTGTETRKGVLELATTGEASTGTDTTRAVTPAGVKAAVPAQICIACSDETTALTTGTAKTTFRMPAAMTLTAVRATVTTAPAGSVLTVDINEGGSPILSTKLTIDASEKTSTSAATAAVISDSALADDAEITIDIDGVGSGTAGAGLKVWLIGTWT